MSVIESLLVRAQCASRGAQRERAAEHLLAQLVCLGTHTITGVLSACGRQFEDWTAHYRMYGKGRVEPERLFAAVREQLCQATQGPLVAALDDTRLRKTGRKVHGAKYVRDPLGPPFHLNLIRAQRFLQTSMAWSDAQGAARMIPVDWVHAPWPDKPARDADAQERRDYHARALAARIGAVGAQRLAHLRAWLDQNGAAARPLWAVVDGSFTNSSVLKSLPHHTTLVGRIRLDAKLYHLPQTQPCAQGRRRTYGERAPTPEQLRLDEHHPWQTHTVFFGGAPRELRVKQLGPLRWRAAGAQHTVQLLVIAPTRYRLSTHSKLLYRQPAYLLCTDPHAPVQQLIQHYLWRWDIEVNFRDQKTLLGLGEAQVRTPHAVQNVTALAVAAYATLLSASCLCRANNTPTDHLPAPKWQRRKTQRTTTPDLIRNLRYELWSRAIHFSGFALQAQPDPKPKKTKIPLESALFYASRSA